jgi:hypothetical protein
MPPAAFPRIQNASRLHRLFQMRQLVGILPRDAEVGGKQGDSLRQLNIRGGVIRLAGGVKLLE